MYEIRKQKLAEFVSWTSQHITGDEGMERGHKGMERGHKPFLSFIFKCGEK